MRISKKWIRNVENYLGEVPAGEQYRIIHAPASAAQLSRTGFPEPTPNGATVLPAIVGPVSRFNAEGRWITRKDLPKESRYIRTLSWKWKTWGGEEHEEFKDQFRDCYQREHVPPPSVEMSYAIQAGEAYFVSPVMTHSAEDRDLALHTVNLFLELFRSCEIVAVDLAAYDPPTLERLNWKIFPVGEYPWERVAEHIGHATRRVGESVRVVIADRSRFVVGLDPAAIGVGEGGFDDYMVYMFPEADLVVLECIRRDNALYVFRGDWRNVSQLTKAQIINADLYHARIIHSDGWKGRLLALFQ